MHKCGSDGPDKLIYVTFTCDLDLQPTKKMFQMALLLKDKIILRSIPKCRSYGPDKSRRTHAHIPNSKIHVVTAMSRFTKRARQKVKNNRIYYQSQMQTEKSQPEGKWIMPETRFIKFSALSLNLRVGISRSASQTDD